MMDRIVIKAKPPITPPIIAPVGYSAGSGRRDPTAPGGFESSTFTIVIRSGGNHSNRWEDLRNNSHKITSFDRSRFIYP